MWKKILTVLGIIFGALVAFLTANSGKIYKQNQKIKKLEEEKKDLELEEAIMIGNAKRAKRKVIKSKEELVKERENVKKTYGVNFRNRDELIKFIEGSE